MLILLGVSASYDQEVLTGNEPNELLEPEDLPLDSLVLLPLELLKLFVSCILRLLNCSILGFGSLAYLDVSLLLDLIELTHVHLGGD